MKTLKVLFLAMLITAIASPAKACICDPNFTVEKICPTISKVGDEVCYTVIITNTGDMPLLIASVEDSLCEFDNCIGVTLLPGEECTDECCFLVPPDAPDPLINEVEVEAGVILTATSLFRSSQCETDLVEPGIDIEKTVNDPNACPGETVIYTICIENTGDWPLENVVVTDPDLGGILPEFPHILFPGEIACADFPYVIPPDAPCPLVNCAEVTANPLDLPNVIDANDCAEICCEPPGDEGCTPGFWKNNADKHSASAWCDAYAPDDSFNDVFGVDVELRGNGRNTISNPTLLQALGANGSGINALARHATAALLNACSGCVNYAMASPVQVIVAVQEAVAVGDEAIQALHEELAYYNEAGCPVNQQAECVGVEESD